MNNDPLSIDLRKLKKPAPADSPVVEPASPPHAAVTPPGPVKMPSPASVQTVKAPTSMAAPTLPPRRKRKASPFLKYAIYLVAAVVLAIGAYYIYVHFWTRSPFGPTTDPASAAASGAQATPAAELTESEIVSKVGALMLLPSDETPSLAKVSDPSALSSEAFFKNAQVGDIVLMYAKAHRAILYDPAKDKIIEVAPITDASSTPGR